ncbi:MAG: hypothetical protein ACC631_10450, partial [Halocynthiibacter sp.]
GGANGASGGQREFAPVLARAAVALGISAVFIETHETPDSAPSDGPSMIALDDMPALVKILMDFDRLAKSNPLQLRRTPDALSEAGPDRCRKHLGLFARPDDHADRISGI